MDAFVRRLVERLHDAGAPLSRNRHFHTFETPEGRRALRTSRRLKSLQRDILHCHAQGQPARVHLPNSSEARVELSFERVKGRRVAVLEAEEFELLLALPQVRGALVMPPGPGTPATATSAAPPRRRP